MAFISDLIYHKVVEETQHLLARLAPDSPPSSEEINVCNADQLGEHEVTTSTE